MVPHFWCTLEPYIMVKNGHRGSNEEPLFRGIRRNRISQWCIARENTQTYKACWIYFSCTVNNANKYTKMKIQYKCGILYVKQTLRNTDAVQNKRLCFFKAKPLNIFFNHSGTRLLLDEYFLLRSASLPTLLLHNNRLICRWLELKDVMS